MNLQSKFHFFYKNFYFFVFFVVNIIFLSQYPFLHSDEPWLSGLSRAIIENKTTVITEPFFDLFPRFPHAIKILFHFIQIPFIGLFGYGPFSVRLISLIAATAALSLLYRLLRRWSSGHSAVWITLLLAVDIQFIYQSHFARQEMLLVTVMLGALLLYARGRQEGKLGRYRQSAVLIGLSIGIHPNSFLVALVVGAFFAIDLLDRLIKFFQDKYTSSKSHSGDRSSLRPSPLATELRKTGEYIGILAAFALLWIGLSYLMDPGFLKHYGAFGDRVGVGEPLYMKFFTFPDFYAKLWYRVSGTYYTPDIRFQFYLFGLSLAAAFPALLLCSARRIIISKLLTALTFLNLGTLVLGKYSQPSILFHFPLYYLLLAVVLDSIFLKIKDPGDAIRHKASRTGKTRGLNLVCTALLVASLLNTACNISAEFHLIGAKSATRYESYDEYVDQLAEIVPPDARVLANLNAEYYFDYGVLHDYRNLSYLQDEEIKFSEYISQNRIEYIVYPAEMDLIYERRPVWNILYGNVAAYYEEMKAFLDEECRLVGSFNSPVYGMRITRYSGTQPWPVKIYKIKK